MNTADGKGQQNGKCVFSESSNKHLQWKGSDFSIKIVVEKVIDSWMGNTSGDGKESRWSW